MRCAVTVCGIILSIHITYTCRRGHTEAERCSIMSLSNFDRELKCSTYQYEQEQERPVRVKIQRMSRPCVWNHCILRTRPIASQYRHFCLHTRVSTRIDQHPSGSKSIRLTLEREPNEIGEEKTCNAYLWILIRSQLFKLCTICQLTWTATDACI